MTKKGRLTNEVRERAKAMLAEGRGADEVSKELGFGRKARAWLRTAAARSGDARNAAPNDGGFLAAGAAGGSARIGAMDSSPSPGEPPAAVIAESFGPPPADPQAPPPTEGAEDFDDPLAKPLTQGELVGMAELVVGTVDSALAAAFGGPPAQGLSDGQRGFLKVFHKRIAQAVTDLGALDSMGPKDVLLLTLGVLIVPRGIQRVGGYWRRKRDAGGSLPRGAEDGEDARRDPVVQGPVPTS